MKMRHKFVEYIPDELESGTLFISMKYGTALHLCCCGCKQEVVTPFSPNDWSLTFNGETVSLTPSIGNWEFNCRSHYWIKKGQIIWAEKWNEKQIIDSRINNQLTSNKVEPLKIGFITKLIKLIKGFFSN